MNVKIITDVDHHIRSTQVQPCHVLYKLDIVDLYTNMNRADIIAVVDQISEEPSLCCPRSHTRRFVEAVSGLCLSDNTLFIFNSKVYRKLSGLPQGAPDSGLLAYILLDYTLQIHHHATFINCGVVFYHKYVDDFLFYFLVDKRLELVQLVQFHTGLSFSIEAEVMCASACFCVL